MIDLSKYKSLLFDLGGVILNIDSSRTDKAFARLVGADSLDKVRRARQDPIFQQYERGEISSAEFRVAVSQLLGLAVSDDRFDAAWNELLLNIPTARIQLLAALRKRYRVLLFSNTNEIHHQAIDSYVQKEFGVRDLSSLFEVAHYSYLEGVRKPDVSAYKKVLEKSSLVPSETLFIDDSAENIRGAEQAGLAVYHHAQGDLVDLF